MTSPTGKTKQLSGLAPGRYTIYNVIISEKCGSSERNFASRARLFGIAGGNTVTVVKKNRSAVIIRTPFGRFAIGNGLADMILVYTE